jgi:predicted MPP superfamily phosphohydrolase
MRIWVVKQVVSFIIVAGFAVAVYAAEAYLIIRAVKSRQRGQRVTGLFWSKRAMIIHFLALLGAACFLYGYFIERYWIEIKTVEISTPKIHQPVRLVQISDPHCDNKPGNEMKLVEIINGLNPDVIVFTGDIANTKKGLNRFKEIARQLDAKLGKFAVRGNLDIDRWKDTDIFRKTGFVELDGNSVEITKDGDKICISGTAFYNEKNVVDMLKKLPADAFSIFLHHSPDLIEDLNGAGADLYLAGHTHGGQIALPFYGAVITLSKFGKKYESGEYKVGDTVLYVNRGLGLAAGLNLKLRFLARPEITVFDLKPK